MEKGKKIVWLDTYCDGGHSYEEYVEWCEDNELGADVEGSEDYLEWISEMIADDVDCFFADLQYSEVNDQPVVISGSLGLWWGRPSIENQMERSLSDAIHKCADGVDAVEVFSENGVVHVIGIHHDGRNHFEIRPLTARGKEMMEEGEDICTGNHWHTSKFPTYLY